ncbi:aminopeptidase N [Terasakiispira papahanaumokuakeensis]|uniref:Aminopeptidase N n=1 Tax=Terasakiispira papahanaumokuakeensis TaxID=197479 RepID=A0A1E2V6Z9_9GAMM|nr:aminopeptidase N [Terasakiispira papahanaumokuakeensis]ODC02761.1 aminopeptidase N [Terasakiispira papahanaumokuakeensis]
MNAIQPEAAQPQAIYLKDYQAPAFWVDQVKLDVALDDHQTRVISTLSLRRNDQREAGLPLVLNGQGLTLKRIELAGQPLAETDYQYQEDLLTVARVPDQFTLVTEVEIDPANNTALEGLYKSNTMFCTQCEAEGFRRITFFPDRPDVLTRFTTRIEADQQRFPILLSNGNPIERGELDNGRHFVTWEDPFPKPCYLFALVGGNLQAVKDTFTTMSGREVALEIWVEPENLHKCDHAMRSLKASMRWDEQTYGREYDLDIFMIVAVNDFNMGAMENKGLNIFNSACVLAEPKSETDAAFQRVEGVVGHEYFHNWSGNRVTCRDWFQLSLKEGFTVYRDQSFSADMNSAPVKRIEDVAMLRTAQFAEDAGPTAHPVRPDHYIEINNFYTLTIYEKGAEVVRMMAELLGRERFRQATDLYFERHDGEAATVEDFVACMAEVSELDFSQFMRWYHQAGTPKIEASGHFDADARTYQLTLRQHTPATPGQADKLPLHIPVRMGLVGPNGHDLPLELNGEQLGTETVLHLREAEQTFTFHNIAAEPVPSLLRGFSAPVKLAFDYSREQLAFLMAHDSDGFNRWDAGQRLAVLALQHLVNQIQANEPLQLDPALIEATRTLLNGEMTDKAVLAEMLRLPSEAYLAEQYEQVDVDAIHKARSFARKALADALYDDFLRLYKVNQRVGDYAPEANQIAERSLKNTCLGYLMAREDEATIALTQEQFNCADNMTDQRAALTLLAHAEDPRLGAEPLRRFGESWAHDPLVMDQWFSLQVTRPQADALDRLKMLMAHPAFSLKNPNRVRALIGAFVGQNRVNFHRQDGQGYQLLADVVIELNRLNPQIAARLVIPLTRWKRMTSERQDMMKAQLERIRQESLSPDLFEIIEKALAA